ncbi:hypothetical protein K474DRAFT_1608686 [Panus rudis PR-1116 ss-1]|nr:hypothetical protein K474DRAFT_1608686 [Panus rudis PR-1116 ss-1]
MDIVHESVSKGSKRKGSGRNAQTKYTPPDETSEQRNARTIFIGNVAMEVVKSRPLTKQLKRHILTAVPSAKIESIRFRSVAFSKPTAALPTDEDKSKSKGTPSKDGKKHGRERAAKWREENDDDEGEVAANAGRTFLSPSEKKKVAFIKHEFHSEVDSTNAYIVFAHPVPESAPRPANLPPPKPVMDPYEAARVAAEQMDGSTFLGRTIRVDVVGKGDKDQGQMSGDPKKTVFVGNLDFASKEEDLRAFFEGLMVTERGPPPAGGEDGKSDNESDEEEDEDEAKGKSKAKVVKPPTWVKRVRLIRDKDTLLGKGFGYVQFVDRECVDEILSLEPERLKFAKRKLRVQRCKTLPGGPKVSASQPPTKRAAATTSAAPGRPARPAKAIAIPSNAPLPKGNPLLGEKISHLSKDERKKVKSTDADRVARRLAKKKAKAQMALQEKGIKAKDKERVRKRPKDKMKSKQSGGDKKKRVRSQKAIAKLNTKK